MPSQSERKMKIMSIKPGQTASKLKVTIRQWKEILNKEMAYSADLRNQARATDAFTMVLTLEAELAEIECFQS